MSIGIQTNRGFVKVTSPSIDSYPRINLGRVKSDTSSFTEPNTNKTTNCPNCGAPITGSRCEYCGTDFGASAMWGMTM